MLKSRDEVALSEEAHLWTFKFSKTCNAAETFCKLLLLYSFRNKIDKRTCPFWQKIAKRTRPQWQNHFLLTPIIPPIIPKTTPAIIIIIDCNSNPKCQFNILDVK